MNKLRMTRIYCSLILIFSLNFNNLLAQNPLPDGVIGTTSYIDEILKNYNQENAIPFDLNNITLSANIPIRMNVIKNKKGLTGIDVSFVYASLDIANSFFQNIGIKFYVDSVNFINDYKFSHIENNNKKSELLTRFAVSDKINLFLADSIYFNTRVYGFTYFPNEPDSNFIFLDKKYITGNYLTTLLGHFMGLLSTHDRTKDDELADESNCATGGDMICDTYGDPDLFLKVDENCKYFGMSKDTHGDPYVPTVANMMSNTTDHCKCTFTPLQYRRMYYYYLKYRNKLASK